jgi:hypothetical protein
MEKIKIKLTTISNFILRNRILSNKIKKKIKLLKLRKILRYNLIKEKINKKSLFAKLQSYLAFLIVFTTLENQVFIFIIYSNNHKLRGQRRQLIF